MNPDCAHQYSQELTFPCECGKTKTYRRHCTKCWIYERREEDGPWKVDQEWIKALEEIRKNTAPAGGS